jgi:flagellar basal body rod protein FlgC
MSLKSYREWKSTKVNEDFNPASTASQGRSALKAMNPRITAFASNLANLLSQLDNTKPGYAKQLLTRLISKLDDPNPVLKQKLLQAVRYLPDPEPEQPAQPAQPQQNV